MTNHQPSQIATSQTTTDSANEQRLARALRAIEKLQAKLSAAEDEKTEPIAIVGIGCRFPGGANSPAEFWQLLSEGKDAITEVPSDRWDAEAYYDRNPDAPGKIVTCNGGFVGHLKDFDADFFGISPREAISLDPQQRLLLEVSWEAMEHGGIVPAQWTGHPVGVFVGISSSDYSQHLSNRADSEIDAYLATGNAHSVAAGRLSYSLGFTGPSLGVDTACSSSLVAVHLACQSLRNGDCEVALAGGVNRIISPAFSINFSKAHMLAPNGRCKTFDADADGFARGEGCGVVVLKRLKDAIAHGDNILALVRGSAVNQDGRSSGLTVPNGPAQQSVIRQALANAKVQPEQVSYLEAHGTGTSLGDPIEVGALGAVFGQSHTHEQPLKIGSVKTNIGHLEAAAGIAGLIKVVLAMQHKRLPAHLHFQQPSPHIDWAALPIQVTTKEREWKAGHSVGISLEKDPSVFAGVSSFGFGGTNAHVVLESAVESVAKRTVEETVEPSSDSHLLVLSAKKSVALKALAERYSERLDSLEPSEFGDLCWSAWALRSTFSHRLAIIASSVSEAKAHLSTYLLDSQRQNLFGLESAASQNGKNEVLTTLAQQYIQGNDISWPNTAGNRVELPTYPFQREAYWVDVQPLREKRAFGRSHQNIHPLVGNRITLAGTPTIHFETTIAPTAVPFLQEHQVFGATVLPAVGYLEMALAAGKAIQSDTDSLDYWTIDDVNFHQALLLDTAQTVQIVLTPKEDQHYFEVFSLLESQEWQRHASGYIGRKAVDAGSDEPINIENLKHLCPSEVPAAKCYERLSAQGVTYGDSFRALQQVYTGEAQALSRLKLPKNLLPTLETYSLHPVLFDACLQSIAAIFVDSPLSETYLPAAMGQLHCNISSLDSAELWSHVEVTQKDNWLIANIQLISLDGERLATLTGLRLQPASVERVLASPTRQSASTEDWFYTTAWESMPLPVNAALPDASSVVRSLADKFSQALTQPTIQFYLGLLPKLEHLSLSYIFQALTSLSGKDALPQTLEADALIQQWKIVPAHQALFRHLLKVISTAEDVEWKQVNIQQQLLDLRPAAKAELALIQRCGENLADVLQGNIDPLTLLFPAGDASELTQLYQSSPGAQLMNQQVQQIVSRLISATDRPLRILEIGAGTGGTTAHLLPCLGSAEYVFTDISPLFLANAKKRFSNSPNLTFQRLDIEKSVEEQGFSLSDFDVVIAANVLHATANVTQVLENVRSLLAPNGQLILLEGTQPLLWLDLIFGMTEGWWKRPTHPLLSVTQWQQHLRTAGFSAAIPLQPSANTGDLKLPQSILVATQSAEPVKNTNWLILAEPTAELGDAIAHKLKGKLVQVEASHSHTEALTEALTTTNPSPDRIVYLVGQPSARNLHTLSGEALKTVTKQTATELLTLLKSQINTKHPITQLIIVTQGVTDGSGGLTQSPAWGLARVIELEHPSLHCRRIDLDPSDTAEVQLKCLCQELQATTNEKSVAYRQKERSVARLSNHLSSHNLTVPSEPFTLALPTKGSPENLKLVAAKQQQLQPGDVKIRVQAAGLNFIDVLDALALLPFDRDWLGVECAGEIVAKGDDVKSFDVGDRVLALAAGSFSQYVTVSADLVVVQPQRLTAQAAATIPANFLTGHYALQQVAQLQKGERVLIHAAAGGTGMAAVKIAQQVGAEIYATASPGKWPALEALGVTHIMNSRTVDFADEIMVKTDGQGVNVVMNSLSGEFIGKGLSVLAKDGRFVEIGKRDIWTAQQVAEARPDVSYYIVDLMSVAKERPADIQTMLRSLTHQFNSGQLTPIPHRTFPITAAPQAFRHMQQAQHIGKIVLDMQVSLERDASIVKADGTYLITGGTGGLGLATAQWLVEQGAQHLVLLSRGQAKTPAADSWIQQSLAQDVEILVLQADVADWAQIEAAFATIHGTMPPLKGVVHAAGVLEDGVLQQLNWEQMQKVLAPKVWGAWHLHQLTETYAETESLDFFALYSSAASLLGSPGQGAHVAANSFLDALAHHRHAKGSPALSINWGPWAEVGSAAGTQAQRQMQQKGIGAIAPRQGIQALSQLLSQTLTQPNLTQVGVIPINWPQFQQQGIKSDLFFSNFTERTDSAQSLDNHSQSSKESHWLNQLNQLPPRRRSAFLTEVLQAAVSKVLGLSKHKQVEPTASFFDLGMDSLMAVELKNQIDTQLGQPISSTVIFEYPTLQTLSAHLVDVIDGVTVDKSEVDKSAIHESVPIPPAANHASDSDSPSIQKPPDPPIEPTPDIEQELAALESLLNRV